MARKMNKTLCSAKLETESYITITNELTKKNLITENVYQCWLGKK